jgi:hypothetical protein
MMMRPSKGQGASIHLTFNEGIELKNNIRRRGNTWVATSDYTESCSLGATR